MGNRTGQAGNRRTKTAPMVPTPSANRRADDGARQRAIRRMVRTHNAFEIHPGIREGVALTALTPACRPAMPGPGTRDEQPGAERAQRAEAPTAMPAAPLPAVNARPVLYRQHHLADMVGALQLGMRAGGVLEREGLVDDGLDLARFEQWPDFFLETARHAALVRRALWPQRRAGERQSIHHHHGGADRRGGALLDGDDDAPSILFQELQFFGQIVARHHVERDVDAARQLP